MSDHAIVSSEEWLTARKELLQKEKEFTKLREELTKQRQNLPWEKIEKDYIFEGSEGDESLSDLFGECNQLLIYHFMFGPDWPEGCKVCSMLGDHYNPLTVHLKQRDVSLVTVSRAPLLVLEAYQQRMGWNFKWVSSLDNDFNRDFHVTFTPEELEAGTAYYNYTEGAIFPASEAPGISSFYKDESGTIFHTYSAFARGLENFLGIYHFLDIVPKGRDEDDLPFTMAWVRHHDKYDESDDSA